MRALRRLVEGRRSLVDGRTRLTNRITSALKAYFPQVLNWFRDKDAAIFTDSSSAGRLSRPRSEPDATRSSTSSARATYAMQQLSYAASRRSVPSARCTPTPR
jgi:hypothetical protein